MNKEKEGRRRGGEKWSRLPHLLVLVWLKNHVELLIDLLLKIYPNTKQVKKREIKRISERAGGREEEIKEREGRRKRAQTSSVLIGQRSMNVWTCEFLARSYG